MRAFLVASVTLLFLAIPLAAAQTHEHMSGDGMAMVLRDGPDSGRAVVGGIAHFGFALLDPKGVPAVHRNAEFTVTQDGVTVFATKDTHEYDGLFSFDYMFTQPGAYTVTAMSDKMTTTVFNGTAVMPVNESIAKVDFKGVTGTDNVLKGTLSIVDGAGQIIQHSDALLEFRAAGTNRLVARTHTHIHDAPIQFEQALPSLSPTGGDFVLQVTAYKASASGKAPDLRAVLARFPIHVGAASTPILPQDPGMPGTLKPTGESAHSGDYTLYGMYDPQNQIAFGSPIRLSGLIEGASMMPMPHVDFTFTMSGPRGEIFSSKSIHEYDGVFEYLYVPEAPGLYDAVLTADAGATKLTVPYHVQVLPPVSPLSMSAGPAVITAKGLDKLKAGEPTDISFHVAGANGPIQHSEVDVTIAQKDAPALYQFKLHTHGSGDTKATVVFPTGGEWLVSIDGASTSPDAVIFQPTVFKAKVDGPATTDIKPLASQTNNARTVPGLDTLALVGVAAALALLARKR